MNSYVSLGRILNLLLITTVQRIFKTKIHQQIRRENMVS